jgi:hypothetical protein
VKTPLELAFDTLADAIERRILERINKLPSGKRLVGTIGAAEYLHCTDKAIYNKVARGELTPVRIDRNLRFDLRDLDQIIEDGKGEYGR